VNRTRPRRARRLARFLIAPALVAGLFAPAAHAAQVGMVGDITWGQSQADVDREVAVMKDAGARWVRANVNWRWLEPDRQGGIDAGMLAQYDYAIDKARAAGLEVLMPIADAVPYWASGDPNKHIDGSGQRVWNRYYPPARMSDFTAFTRFVVEHYKAKGVRAYEIWNEPNTSWFWAPGPNAGQYTEMLKASYPAVKAADPSATVVLGGLSRSDFEYLEDVYRAGGGAYFDAVAVHPYTYGMDPTVSWNGTNAGEDPSRISWNAFPAIKEIKATMNAFGDSGKQVWITEFGYSTTSKDGGVTPAQQADYLVKAYRYVEQFPWVHSVFTYQIRNNPFYRDADEFEGQFGLTTAGWEPKPAFAALKAYAAAAAPPAEGEPPPSGGDTTVPPPTVSPKRPKKPRRLNSARLRQVAVIHHRRPRAVTVYGQVPRALSPKRILRLELQRRVGRGWHKRRVTVRLRGTRYRKVLRRAHLRRGQWRVRAIVITQDGGRKRSAFRRFRV
jgi:polysaccharide biosynthesis protein PslG